MVESWTAAWIWGHQVQNQAIFIPLTLNFKPFILCVLCMVSCSVHSNKIFKYEANINKSRRSVVISIGKFCLLVVFFKCVDCGTKLALVFDAELILITEMATLII